MTATPPQPRHPLLPDLGGSRAVLVACDDPAVVVQDTQPGVRAAELAQALVSPTTGPAFDPAHVTLVRSGDDAGEVVDTVRRAAAEASDVLLFHYVGTGKRHEQLTLPGGDPETRGTPPLQAVGDLVRRSRAARRVVLLDCEHLKTVAGYVAPLPGAAGSTSVLGKQPAMYFGTAEAPIPAGDEFTGTLAAVLRGGVRNGPPVLDLVTLRNAVEGQWATIRYYVENEWIGGPEQLSWFGGEDVALGVNRVFGNPDAGGFHLDAAAADEAERWWD